MKSKIFGKDPKVISHILRCTGCQTVFKIKSFPDFEKGAFLCQQCSNIRLYPFATTSPPDKFPTMTTILCRGCGEAMVPSDYWPDTCSKCRLLKDGLGNYLFSPTYLEGSMQDTQPKIIATCDAIKQMLLEKNKAYGNSALDPTRVFSKADTVEQLKVRIDDKLSRISRGAAMGEDVINDLIGYLVLLKIALNKECK